MAQKKVDTISDTDVLQAPQNEKELFSTEEVFSGENHSTINTKQENKVVNPKITDIPKTVLKQPERDSRIFMLSNDKRQGNVVIDFEEAVYDPETKSVRSMRLLRRAPSIWLDEQPAASFPPAYVQKNTLTVVFHKGKALVPIHEWQILKAMELSNRNVDNKHRQGSKDIYYKEWNPVIENQKAIKEEDDVIKAMTLAVEAPAEEMIQHANYLNIQFVDEQGLAFDEKALRAAYIRFAKNNATKFLTSIQSPTVKIAYLVRKASENGKIDLGLQAGAAYWQDGGFITALPEGRDSIEYLIEYAMTHGEGNAQFLNQLRSQLN